MLKLRSCEEFGVKVQVVDVTVVLLANNTQVGASNAGVIYKKVI